MQSVSSLEILPQASHPIDAKPILKWAGGKASLLPQLIPHFPDFAKHMITDYIEPFIGGGAVFFHLASSHSFKNVVLCDSNIALINLYKMIQKNVYELIFHLSCLEKSYQKLATEEERKVFFYDIREKFNATLAKQNHDENLQQASYFIFLNRTCFNGLFRVNQSGLFNVSFGRYKNPRILDRTRLMRVSELLKNVVLLCGDFEKIDPYISKKSFIYYDPPYKPISKTAHFNQYAGVFGDAEQQRLVDFFKKSHAHHALQMLSNSDPFAENGDPFFQERYQDFHIHKIFAKRMINSKADKRGVISEILVRNYEIL